MTDAQWLEILVRMVAGEAAEEPSEGVLAVRLDEDSDALTRFHVRKHGHRWRVDDESGRPWSIQGDSHGYAFHRDERDGDVPQRLERGAGRMHGQLGEALARPRPVDWVVGGDWVHDTSVELAGPPRRTSYLGRDVWEVRLVLPRSRQEARYVVDVADGRTLLCEHGDDGTIFRWEELASAEPHHGDLFTWEGRYETGFVTFGEEDAPEGFRELLAQQRAFADTVVADLDLGDLVVTSPGTTDAHVVGQGEVQVLWNASAWFSLLRTSVDAEREDDEDDDEHRGSGMHGAVTTSWSDDRWHWTAHVADHVPDAERQRLVTHLQARTHALSTTPDP